MKVFGHVSDRLVFSGSVSIIAKTADDARKMAKAELARVYGEQLAGLIAGHNDITLIGRGQLTNGQGTAFTCLYSYQRDNGGSRSMMEDVG